MRVILRMEIMGVSKEGFVRLYRTCREYHASIKHTDPASDSFYARMHFSDLDENTLLRIKEFVRRIDEISSYCEVLVTAIIPHENLPYTEATPKHGCPKRIERCLRRICVKYIRRQNTSLHAFAIVMHAKLVTITHSTTLEQLITWILECSV